MKNITTILRRELGVYFQSLIGYLVLVVFLAITIGLYITPFFTYPVADMRNFFNLIPIILSIFIPAITMRLWAEERRENTFEMLMTFPMKSYEIVLGKYLAAIVFYLVALAGTLIIPLMLFIIGNPDGGQIFCSYLGSILLGAMLLALGLFLSSLCKDQIVAFISTLLVNVLILLFGMDFIKAYLDGVISGLGRFLGSILAYNEAYDGFSKGVIELTAILYFLSWIALFLFLNGFFLELNNRPNRRIHFGAGVFLAIVAGLLFNWLIVDATVIRIDLTEGQVFTVSDSTKRLLADFKVPVNIKYYVSPKDKMPPELGTLERDVKDKLEEMRIASEGKLKIDLIHMEAENIIGEKTEKKGENAEPENSVEKRLFEKGVKPFSVRALRKDSVTNVLIYSAIGLAYKDKREEILPQIVPQNLHELEYQVMSGIRKLTLAKAPTVALYAPKQAYTIPPQLREIYLKMGKSIPTTEDPYEYLEQILRNEKYDVHRIELDQQSPLPKDYDTMIVINPREMTKEKKIEIAGALIKGKNVLLAVQEMNWNYRIQDRRIAILRQEENPMIADLLGTYGLTVSRDILMDDNHQPLTVADPSNPLSRILGSGITLDLPIQMVFGQDSMNQDISITSRLSGLFYLWGSAITIEEDTLSRHGLRSTILVSTSKNGWTTPVTESLSQDSFKPPSDGKRAIPVAVMVEGRFPDFPSTNTIPDDRPSSKLILVGGTQMFQKNFLKRSNLDFFLNCTDALSLGDELITIRTKKAIERIIQKPSDTVKTFWKIAHYLLVNITIAMIGLIVLIRRKRSREHYIAAFSKRAFPAGHQQQTEG